MPIFPTHITDLHLFYANVYIQLVYRLCTTCVQVVTRIFAGREGSVMGAVNRFGCQRSAISAVMWISVGPSALNASKVAVTKASKLSGRVALAP